MNNSLKRPDPKVLIAFLAVPVLLYITVAVGPILFSLRFSMDKWTGGLAREFIGLENYVKLLQDSGFWLSFKNTFTITVLAVLGQVGGGVTVALILFSEIVRFRRFHRTVIFFPVVMSTVVIGLIWLIIYSADAGLLDKFLEAVGLQRLIIGWLDDPRYIIFTISVPIMWQYIGLYMVIIMASLENIPRDVLESAEIDGATGIKRTRYITIPLVYDTIKVALTICIAGTMRIFDHIFVMTGGGPGDSSTVLALYAYKMSFVRLNMGYGNAVAISILVISMCIVLATRKAMGGKRYE